VGDGTFEFMEGVVVDESGNASFAFTHASDYVIAVTEVPYEGQELNPKPEPETESEPEAEKQSEAIEESEVPVDALEENEAESVGMDVIAPIAEESSEAGGINMIPWIIVGSVLMIVVGIVVVMIRKRK
jgi:hypothetical protein